MLFIGGTEGGICNVHYPGGAALIYLLAAVLCGSPATVCPYPISTAGGLFLWVLWREKMFCRMFTLLQYVSVNTTTTSCVDGNILQESKYSENKTG